MVAARQFHRWDRNRVAQLLLGGFPAGDWLLDPFASFEQPEHGRVIGLDFVSRVAAFAELFEKTAAQGKAGRLDVVVEPLLLTSDVCQTSVLLEFRRRFDHQSRFVAEGQRPERRVRVLEGTLADPFDLSLQEHGDLSPRQSIDDKIGVSDQSEAEGGYGCSQNAWEMHNASQVQSFPYSGR